MSNWTRNILIPASEWHFEVSCCRNAIISIRILQFSMLIVTTFTAFIYIRILSKAKIVHANLRLLFTVSVLNDWFLFMIRIFDMINVSGLLDENFVLSFFKYNVVVILTIVCERICSVLARKRYEEV
ncbi:hypothetical protein PMAYCL1PPCAC_16840 [Pristionchus mayeri]|uniref:Uncharacterized protein n=1 Tax=Pristionchus mayeri TaxID=1317129 RepID=A0AAN5CLR6_9BILA|nr:hypothetical protein PMAYCL1PPCAC_16840 [Pristionchus mayeri]